MDDQRTRRMAQNEALSRRINDRIEYQRPRNGESADTFICECALADCEGVLDLSIGEYARVRSHPRRFVVSQGMRHQRSRRPSRSTPVTSSSKSAARRDGSRKPSRASGARVHAAECPDSRSPHLGAALGFGLTWGLTGPHTSQEQQAVQTASSRTGSAALTIRRPIRRRSRPALPPEEMTEPVRPVHRLLPCPHAEPEREDRTTDVVCGAIGYGGEPNPANARSSGGFGNCATGKAARPAHLAAPPKLGDGHRADVRRPAGGRARNRACLDASTLDCPSRRRPRKSAPARLLFAARRASGPEPIPIATRRRRRRSTVGGSVSKTGVCHGAAG